MKAILRSFLCAVLSFPVAQACLWDEDTLAAEQARFPRYIDLITGNFPRHSKEFHQWRIAETRKQLEANPKLLSPYDDLAVSQHKLGDHVAACDTMKTKESLQPGIYETYSNMGTFLIYTGELPKALEFIDKALAINPQAHFGREKYQKWLIEWVMSGMALPDHFELVGERGGIVPFGYAALVLSKQDASNRKAMPDAVRNEALKGIAGMMRFADFDNPILLEALGDLLCAGKGETNATHLACLSYLHASGKTTDAEVKSRLARKLQFAGATVPNMRAAELDVKLDNGLAEGTKLAAKIRDEEMTWIQQGTDVSAEFTKKYLPPEKPQRAP